MKHLLSRLREELSSSAWLLLPLLLAILLPSTSNAATLPSGDPDHEFTVDHVTYKCYFLKKTEATNPTPTFKGTLYYSVYAVPENTSISHCAVMLDWNFDLNEHLPTNDSGYQACQDSQTIRFVTGAWTNCTSLKSIELIVNQSLQDAKFNTTDLGALNNVTSLKTIFVTGGDRYQGATNSPYHVFKSVFVGWQFYSDLDLYAGSKSSGNKLSKKSIGEFVSSLLIENTLDKDMEKCNETGFSPKVEVRPSYLTDNSPFYTLTYDETGKVTAPLVGKLTYKLSLNELVGKHTVTNSKPIELGTEIFDECFAFDPGLAFEILRKQHLKIYEYGYNGILVQNASDDTYLHEEDNGTYFLTKGRYYVYLKYRSLNMRVEHTVVEREAIGLQPSWTPHSVSFTAFIDSVVYKYVFNDQTVYGIAEIDSSDNILRFVPFDENDKAELIQADHMFGSTSAYDTKLYQQTHNLSNLMRCSLCSKVKGRYVLSGTKYSNDNVQGWRCESLKFTDRIVVVFNPLRDNGHITNNKKCGVIYKGAKYNPDPYGSWQLEIPDLMPDDYNKLQLFYEYDGQEYVSNEITVMTQPITVSLTVSPGTQSATVTFGYTHFSDSQGEIEYDKWSVYKSGTGKVDVDIEQKSKNSFIISGLEPGTYEYHLYVNCYYRRKSDGKRLQISNSQTKFNTLSPQWNDGESQALTTTKARLMYSTNLENVADTYVEWRRVDAPSVVQSTKAICPVVNGRLVGVLNNLNPDVYYQFRPVYENGSNKYTGQWIGIFTGDANVWFDPEVETQPARVRGDGSVTLRGSVLPGSGDISEQGFEVWPSEDGENAPVYGGSRAEAGHRFVACEGISMSVDLSDLTPGRTYTYRTYAKVNGDTHTGSEQTFSIPGTGAVDGIAVDEDAVEIIGYYNLQGVRSDKPFGGMNIVVYSNGKTEKRIFKNL